MKEQVERNRAIYELAKQGVTHYRIGKLYLLSKQRIAAIVAREKEREKCAALQGK